MYLSGFAWKDGSQKYYMTIFKQQNLISKKLWKRNLID